MSDSVFRTVDGRPILWIDRTIVCHRCEGAYVHQGIRLIWTDCGRDVPANEAFTGGGAVRVNCPACLARVS